MGVSDICFKEKPDRPCRSGAMIGSAAESYPARHRLPSGFETKNRRVQRLGRAHGIEILAEEHDLAASSTQEDYIILAVDASRRFDETLRLHFGDRDPASYKPRSLNGKPRKSEVKNRSVQPAKATSAISSFGTQGREPPPVSAGLSLPYPIRSDFLAQVVIPRDLTVEEAKRLGAFLLTLAADFKPGDV
jgi:hypothetical protein